MRIRILLLLFLACCIGCTNSVEPDNDYTLYLVRHSEKIADKSKDPALSEAGKIRSEKLAIWFLEKDIKDIWSSDYRRTRSTAGPLVSKAGSELTLYNPRDLPALAKNLLENQQTALVVGHSNTTPELARLLCQCEIDDMDESEYDRLIVVSVSGDKTSVETLAQSTLFEH